MKKTVNRIAIVSLLALANNNQAAQAPMSMEEAIECNNPAAAQALLENKIDPNQLTNRNKLTNKSLSDISLLECAIRKRRTTIAEQLITHQANVHQIIDLKQQRTPLAIAALRNNIALVNTLLKNKANPEAIDLTGQTPLHWATTPIDPIGKTPEQLATEQQNRLLTIEALMLANADPYYKVQNQTVIDKLLAKPDYDALRVIKQAQDQLAKNKPLPQLMLDRPTSLADSRQKSLLTLSPTTPLAVLPQQQMVDKTTPAENQAAPSSPTKDKIDDRWSLVTLEEDSESEGDCDHWCKSGDNKLVEAKDEGD